MKKSIKGHTRKVGSKVVTVRGHDRKVRFRNVKSSFIDRVSENLDGGYTVTILGKEYPYPYLPDNMINGFLNGGSAGKHYNKKVRGDYF